MIVIRLDSIKFRSSSIIFRQVSHERIISTVSKIRSPSIISNYVSHERIMSTVETQEIRSERLARLEVSIITADE